MNKLAAILLSATLITAQSGGTAFAAVQSPMAQWARAFPAEKSFLSSILIRYNVCADMNQRNKFILIAACALAAGAAAGRAVFGAAENDVSSAYAYPVPFKPSAGHRQITFDLLPVSGKIKIYTSAGKLVREIPFSSPVDGKLTWDVNSSDGENVVTDVYVYVISSGDNRKFGKLLVVR